jgi:hypothetical protein
MKKNYNHCLMVDKWHHFYSFLNLSETIIAERYGQEIEKTDEK